MGLMCRSACLRVLLLRPNKNCEQSELRNRFDIWLSATSTANRQFTRRAHYTSLPPRYAYHRGPWGVRCQLGVMHGGMPTSLEEY
jgi:hypothetical protein